MGSKRPLSQFPVDYSALELRVQEAIARAYEPRLLLLDVHVKTAAEYYGVPPDRVTREMRNVGKAINFAASLTRHGRSLDLGATPLIQRWWLRRTLP